MPDRPQTNLLESLGRLEAMAGGDPEKRAEVDGLYRNLLAANPYSIPLLLARNRFRVRHAGQFADGRPRVLIGGMNEIGFPNFHTIPLLHIADVVSLTARGPAETVDRLRFDPFGERFAQIITRLPPGFAPDLFFDNQIEGHLVPNGIEDSPFPTVASFCHHFRAHQIDILMDLFDYVLPLSAGFAERARRRGVPGQVIDLPFGLNWGSFHYSVAPAPEKPVDLAITFGDGIDVTTLGHRHAVHRRMRDFAEARAGRYTIAFASGLSKLDYLALLSRARIVLNVPGIHGPYNYRLCEAAAAGALVINYEYEGPIRCSIGDYLRMGTEIVTANRDNLEAVVEHYLEDPEATARIAAEGAKAITTRLSYEASYSALFSRVAEDRAAGRAIAKGKPKGAVAATRLGRAYLEWNAPETRPYAVLALSPALHAPAPHRANQLMVLLPILIEAGIRSLDKILSPKMAALCAGAPPHASLIKALAIEAGSSPVSLWNRTMLLARAGKASAEMARETLAALTLNADLAPWSEWFLAVYARPPYFDDLEWEDALLRLRAYRHLASGADRGQELELQHQWMRWHMHRLLLAVTQDAWEREQSRRASLALFDDNATQQMALARESTAVPDALAAVEKVLALYPFFPGAEALKQSLQGQADADRPQRRAGCR